MRIIVEVFRFLEYGFKNIVRVFIDYKEVVRVIVGKVWFILVLLGLGRVFI